ncbi:glycine--tRNA ligase [Candidatus Nomurabacteria bacterium]|nr:glycine--tRNA ligase [Candidatus Nomurabacteria bacterium]MCB9820896.1 glycine--tRNA ligase [Candidatus Nomurabacteria bacterium]
MSEKDNNLMEKLISLCKRRGFIFQGSEIYGGLAGTYDYGPLGSLLKNNIKDSWLKKFVHGREDTYLLDAAILMNGKVWQATGHVDHFSDPLVECKECKHRFRADQIQDTKKCPDCNGDLGDVRQFNMMLSTKVGAVDDTASTTYLRPETAQGIFVNFKNVLDSMSPKLPFGIAQIGKAFRNEITPRDFIFRLREMEQMEIEYFVDPDRWNEEFEYWKDEMMEWMEEIGLNMKNVYPTEIGEGDRAHYSSRTIDFEFDFPFGRKELYGLAYRSDYDLSKHTSSSGQKLEYTYPEGAKIVPHVIEPSFGLDRTILAVLLSAYREDVLKDSEEVRTYLALSPAVAPVICAVSPLLKNKPELVDKAREVHGLIKKEFGRVAWDDNGNIGKRYRRQDEIGTPWCVVVDFDSLEDDTVTIRSRDTGMQERMKVDEVIRFIKDNM